MVTQQPIGSSDIKIAPLNLGGNVFGWTADRATSFEVLEAFLDGGGNFIDTADLYVRGESETIIGAWMAERGTRDRVVIASKVAKHPDFRGLAPANILAAAEASLQRLGVDTIDLYYAHEDDEATPVEEYAAAFSSLVDAGKIRAIGISNFTAERVDEWMRVAAEHNLHAPVAMQPHYSLVERDFETDGLQQAAQRHGLSVFPFFALARGFLTGKYRDAGVTSGGAGVGAAVEAVSPRAEGALQYLDDRGRGVLNALDDIAAAHEVEVASVALAWLRQQPTVGAPIASARNTTQLPPLLVSMALELSADELERLSAT